MVDKQPNKRETIELEDVLQRINIVIREHGTEEMKRTLKAYGTVRLIRSAYQGVKWDKAENRREIKHNHEVLTHNSRYTVVLGEDTDAKEFNHKRAETYHNFRVARFAINQLHTCCACGVLSSAYVDESIREHGLGTLLHNWRLYVCEATARYSMLVCSVVTGLEYWRTGETENHESIQEKVLRKAGWTRQHHVFNIKSGNNVSLFTIQLNPHEED